MAEGSEKQNPKYTRFGGFPRENTTFYRET